MTQCQVAFFIPVLEQTKELISERSNGRATRKVSDIPSNSVDSIDSEHSSIHESFKSMQEMSDPIEILQYLQHQVVTGHISIYNRCQNYLEHNTFLRLNGMILTQLVLILSRPCK